MGDLETEAVLRGVVKLDTMFETSAVDKSHPGVEVTNDDRVEALSTEEQEWVVFIVQHLKLATSLAFLEILFPNAFTDALEDLHDANFSGDQGGGSQGAGGSTFAESSTNPVDALMDLGTDAAAKRLGKLAPDVERRHKQEMGQCDNLTDEMCEHVLPPVSVVLAGAKQTKMLFKDEALGKLFRTSGWITEVTLDVFLERISDASASHQRGSICAVEAAVLTFSD